MEKQKEVDISIGTRSTLLFAEGQRGYAVGRKWLILVHSVTSGNDDSYRLRSHMSYCLTTGNKYVNPLTPGWWGFSDLYKFYEPTEEHKQMMLDILKKKNLKFISALNKLIRVKT
jgi:hypothetical protein